MRAVRAASRPAIATSSNPGRRRKPGACTSRPNDVPRMATLMRGMAPPGCGWRGRFILDRAIAERQPLSGAAGVRRNDVPRMATRMRGMAPPGCGWRGRFILDRAIAERQPLSGAAGVRRPRREARAVLASFANPAPPPVARPIPPGGPMRDPRTRQLAKLIVNHSCELRAGEAVLIEAFDLANGLVLDLVEETQAVGAIPVVFLRDNAVIRAQLASATEAQLKVQAEIKLHQMKQVQAYVGIRASANVSELGDVPAERMSLYQQIVAKPVHLDYRVNHTRWVVLRYPNSAMAQLANMSTEAFERS